jgi:hypothetical protein
MFPEDFVQKHLVWTEKGDIVLDPFSGRGTTVFQSLLSDREGIGGDTNSVAVCVSRAKANAPPLANVLRRLDHLESTFRKARRRRVLDGDQIFFSMCFHQSTLQQVLHLRSELNWRGSRTDAFIAALALGALHGESHKTRWCLSNRMPRTISTKPAYSVRWWTKHGLVAPVRDAFHVLREVALFRYTSAVPDRRGLIVQSDARKLHKRLPTYAGRVKLVITSPPYLDTTDYREDQWLRLWFLGGPPFPENSPQRDDRHRRPNAYWQFLTEAWAGIRSLLAPRAHLVIRLGSKRISQADVEANLIASLQTGLGKRPKLLDQWSSTIVRGQIHSFRPGTEDSKVEHDFHLQI